MMLLCPTSLRASYRITVTFCFKLCANRFNKFQCNEVKATGTSKGLTYAETWSASVCNDIKGVELPAGHAFLSTKKNFEEKNRERLS